MGISYRVNLGLPDGNIQPTPEAGEAIIRLIRATRPALVLCPRPDEGRHPDHGATGRLVPDAAFRAGFRKWETGQPHHRPLRIINYMMHTVFTPTFVVDISDQWERKLETIRCYKSQLGVVGAPTNEEQTYISSPQFLEMIEARARYFGSLVAARYGEPFSQREMMRLDDPMTLVKASVEQFSDQTSSWRR
jgi:bacillithiol biosynthesis deacetylase BshB1